MLQVTNQLVDEVKKMARKPMSVGAGLVLTAALAVSLVFHESSMRAASIPPAVDDNSVAALTALDHHRALLEMRRQVGLRMHDAGDVARLHGIGGEVGHLESL